MIAAGPNSPLASVLPHSDNRWICGFAFGYA